MKNSLIILILLATIIPGCKKSKSSPDSPGQWTQKASLPFPPGRSGGAGFSIADKGYFIGGSNDPVYFNDVYEYDSASNSWSQKTSCPGDHLYNPVYFVMNDKVYIGLGQIETGFSNQFWEYNPSTDVWTRKSDFPDSSWSPPGPFFAIGQYDYLVSILNECWRYDPSLDKWTKLNNPPAGVNSYAGANFVIGNKGYTGAGSDGRAFWEYDPQQDTWSRQKDCPGGGLGTSGTSINGLGYFFNYNPYSYRYDPQKNEWMPVSFFAVRHFGVAFTLQSKIYYAVGGNPWEGLSNEFWEYTP